MVFDSKFLTLDLQFDRSFGIFSYTRYLALYKALCQNQLCITITHTKLNLHVTRYNEIYNFLRKIGLLFPKRFTIN